MCESSLLRSWSSTQNTIALSSAESELYAMSKCAQHALHLKSMGGDFGLVLKPLIRSDASAAIGIAYRRGLSLVRQGMSRCSACGSSRRWQTSM